MSKAAPIFNVVLGTAGHIDHGKSTLVQALTGIHPDRLKEEQERGITIDLGFAPLQLSNGMRVGIIDVPGHEKFVKNMVAGATGIDFVMMVIAADDGVMAQTREHLQIVDLLGVHDGLTVITKKDVVTPDLLELAISDATELMSGTVLDGKPVLAVSAKTGDGLGELKRVLEERLATLKRRESAGPFRMPIQRVFAKEGFGTVVTGVPLSGGVAIGDTLEVLPPGYSGRVKGLHAYKTTITEGRAGHSTAVNLHGPDIDKKDIVRGMVATTPGVFRPTALFTARVSHLSSSPWPLKHRAAVRFHAGTAEIQGKALLLDGEQIAPGQSGWVQIALEEPTVLAPGDRFILRHQTPMVTLGGGTVVDVVSAKRKRMNDSVLSDLKARLNALADSSAFVAHILLAAEEPKTLTDLCSEAGSLPKDMLALLQALISAKKVVALKPDAVFVSPDWMRAVSKSIESGMTDFFKEHPALGAVDRLELKRRLAKSRKDDVDSYFDDVVALLHQAGVLKAAQNEIALTTRERKLEGALADQAAKLEAALKTGGLAPKSPTDIGTELKIQPKTLKEILKFLTDTGRVVEAAPEFVFHVEPYETARAAIVDFMRKQGEATVSELRQLLGMNRKYVVPLVELLDRKGVTIRVGDKRKLKA